METILQIANASLNRGLKRQMLRQEGCLGRIGTKKGRGASPP